MVLRGFGFCVEVKELAVPWKGLTIFRCSCEDIALPSTEFLMCGETRPTGGPEEGGRGTSGCSCLGGDCYTSSFDTISSTSKLWKRSRGALLLGALICEALSVCSCVSGVNELFAYTARPGFFR